MPDVQILLIASDEPTRAAVAGSLTGRGGYRITSYNDGEAALAITKDAPPDVVVLDVTAPHLDVANFVRTLRMQPQTALIPVIFLGEQAPIEEKIQGFQLGSDDFLGRPFEPREVELKVAVANKLREKAESLLRPKLESPDFSSPGIMTAFRGTLDQIGLPSLLSLVDMERKTGVLVLVLEPGKEKARMYFHDGRAVRANYDKKARPKNAELVYELLGRTEGKFEFRNMIVDAKDEIQNPTARLLLEGARLIDESRR